MFKVPAYTTYDLTDETLQRFIAPIPAAAYHPAARHLAFHGETARGYLARHPEMARFDVILDTTGKLLNIRPHDPLVSFLNAEVSR